MVGFKKIAFALATVFIFACPLFAQARPASEQYVFERLLDGHKIINIVDDFLVFWDQAKSETPRRQRRLWMQMVESKHREYFERAVYRNASTEQRRRMLDEFLMRVPSQVDAIREFNKSLSDIRTSILIESLVNFKVRFREYQQRQDIYVALSLFRFDGAVRALNNDAGVPDTLCLGVELLASYRPEQLRVAFIHEFFHLHHFSFLFQQPTLAEFKTPHMPLMIEGMAVAGTEELLPYQPRSLYLHFSDEELTSQQEELASNSGRFLDLLREGASSDRYEGWFTNGQGDEAPPRGGYLLGYEVTKRVLAAFTLDQMVRMTPAQLREHAEEQLSEMAGPGILLMAAAR